MRAREYYGYALIAGLTLSEARHTEPGWIIDFYHMRIIYDLKLAGAKIPHRLGLM